MKTSRCLISICSMLFVGFHFWSSICFAKSRGKLFVLGMGPDGPDLTAPRAIFILEKADVILCSPDMQKRFWKYINLNKVAFNPWEGIHTKEACELRKTNFQEWIKGIERQRKRVKDLALKKINKNKGSRDHIKFVLSQG